MLVVSDASPINILIRLGRDNLLTLLFHSVVIPSSVAEEMSRSGTPEIVRNWMAHAPAWLSIQVPTNPVPGVELRHRGERDAIELARELNADAILLDEDKPRMQAIKLGLRVIGTVGILELAANKGHIRDLEAVHDQLRHTDFYISQKVLNDSLARHLAHKRT